MTDLFTTLIETYETRAQNLEGFSEGAAKAFREAAKTAQAFLEDYLADALPIDLAAAESGYTTGHLRRLINEGKLPATEDGHILRQHLPRKPGRGCEPKSRSEIPSPADIAQRIVEGGNGLVPQRGKARRKPRARL